MSPRILVCLLISIISGMMALVWSVVTGWGVLIGIAAYSLTGSLVLVATVVAASLLDSRREDPDALLSQHVATDIG